MIFRMEGISRKKGLCRKAFQLHHQASLHQESRLGEAWPPKSARIRHNDPAVFWAATDKGERSNGCAMRGTQSGYPKPLQT